MFFFRKPSIVIVDYGMGNLRSVQKAFESLGYSAKVSGDPNVITKANKVVLPGVGAFKACMNNLKKFQLVEPIYEVIQQEKPFLGICMGMQVLFDEGEEFGKHKGLGIFAGKVVRFDLPKKYKIPHMGWNRIIKKTKAKILDGIQDQENFYFVHSYHVIPEDTKIIATITDYGYDFASSVIKDNIYACQFHPEKSQKSGLRLLKNFGGL